jgi:hypothetical protein
VACLACVPWLGALSVRAEAQSPRAAHVVGLFVDQPALLVASDRAFVPSLPDGAVTVCSYESGACAPIRSAEPCSGAACPSGGTLLRLERSLGGVGDLPTDRDGLIHLHGELSHDPRVSSLVRWIAQPPPPPTPGPPPTFHLDEDDWHFVVGLGGGVGTHLGTGAATGSMYGSLAFGIGMTWDREEVLQVLFGTALGAELRVRLLPAIDGGAFEQASVLVGFAPHSIWAPEREAFSVGAGYFSLLPEVGVITHPTLAPALYFGWSYPIAFALDTHVGLEVRPFAYIVDDWVEGDDVAWILGADVNLLGF